MDISLDNSYSSEELVAISVLQEREKAEKQARKELEKEHKKARIQEKEVSKQLRLEQQQAKKRKREEQNAANEANKQLKMATLCHACNSNDASAGQKG